MGFAALTIAVGAFTLSGATLWNWNYTGPGISAHGTFTTVDTPDAHGEFLINSISGERNGVAITGLQAPGTAVPGNEPFAVDDLVLPGPGPQLTVDGFGFSTADGNFANPFFADFTSPPGYLEFFSTPPFTDAGQGSGDSELVVQFSATPIPEPDCTFLFVGAIVIGACQHKLRKHLAREWILIGGGTAPGFGWLPRCQKRTIIMEIVVIAESKPTFRE
jgi:hypothetical protein